MLFTVYDKNKKLIIAAKSFEFAFKELQMDQYKEGEYRIISPYGKEKVIVKYNH